MLLVCFWLPFLEDLQVSRILNHMSKVEMILRALWPPMHVYIPLCILVELLLKTSDNCIFFIIVVSEDLALLWSLIEDVILSITVLYRKFWTHL